MFHLGLNIFILISISSISPAVFSQTQTLLKDLLLEEIPESCKSQEQVEEDLEHYISCIKNDLEIPLLIGLKGTIESGVYEACQMDMSRCIKDFGSEMKSCLSDDKYEEIIDVPVKAIIAAHGYMCKDDGQPLKDLIGMNTDCFNSNSSDIGDNILNCNQENENIQKEWFTYGVYSNEKCGLRVNYAKCLLGEFDKCEDKTGREFFKNLLLSWMNQTPCEKFSEQIH